MRVQYFAIFYLT